MRRVVAAILALVVTLLGGCWDQTALEDTAYVIALGVDWREGGSLWTFLIPRSAGESSGGVRGRDGVQPDASLIAVSAENLMQAVQIVQSSEDRIISLNHLRYVIIGEETARQGLARTVSQLIRHNEVRRGLGISVARGRAVDVMSSFQPALVGNPVKVYEGIMLVQKRMHLTPPIRLQQFHARMLSTSKDPIMSVQAVNPLAGDPPGSTELPEMGHVSRHAGELPHSGGNPVDFAGTAVFRGDRLVGFLTVDETKALLALHGEMGKVYATVPDPLEEGRTIAIRFGQENKPQFRIGFDSGRPVAHVRLQLEGEVLAAPSRVDYSEPENRRVLERFIAQYEKETMYDPLIQKVYNEWGADPVGFGHQFRARFPTIDDWIAFQWFDRIKDLKVTVEIEMFIRRFGLQLEEARPQGGE